MSPNITLKKILALKLQKLNELRPLSTLMIAKLKEKFQIEMTYNSNGIEGNTLTLNETFWIITEGLTVKGKPLKDHLEATNHKEALDYLYDLIEQRKQHTISEALIKNIHSLILQSIDKKQAGQYRNVDVFITGTDHKPPSAFQVPLLMAKLIRWSIEAQKTMHVLEFAARFHHKLVHIHPFTDGNGRTARIIMNLFIMQAGYPLSIIQKNDRQKYYRALAAADKDDYQPLIKLVAQAVLRSINIYLDALIPAADKEQFLTLHDVATNTPYSPAYLGKLAKEGKIDAHKLKRNWVTSKEAVTRYREGVG